MSIQIEVSGDSYAIRQDGKIIGGGSPCIDVTPMSSVERIKKLLRELEAENPEAFWEAISPYR